MSKITKFTDEELEILSSGLLSLIASTNMALTHTYDEVSSKALREAIGKYNVLNQKICELQNK